MVLCNSTPQLSLLFEAWKRITSLGTSFGQRTNPMDISPGEELLIVEPH